ncbi:MAG: hypothetical protein RIA69_11175 [Cyclobacteriaceae bacterium]
MILIADSGGTKTDWRFINSEGKIAQFQTGGFNASTHEISVLNDHIKTVKHLEIEKVYLYIAGLKSSDLKRRIAQLFEVNFPNLKKIEVENDLIGAARGLYNSEDGAVGILGTGSAGFEFRANSISNYVPSLGYLLGNEGSGYDLGKHFVAGLMRNQFSASTLTRFKKLHVWYTEEEMIKRLYTSPQPTFLAQFSKSINENLVDPNVWAMVYNRFFVYLEVFFNEPKPERIRFSGSIAYNFQDILLEACKNFGFSCDRIIESPIAGLTLYHQNHG